MWHEKACQTLGEGGPFRSGWLPLRSTGSAVAELRKPADPWVDQCPFNMNDNVLYHSYRGGTEMPGKFHNAGSRPNVEQNRSAPRCLPNPLGFNRFDEILASSAAWTRGIWILTRMGHQSGNRLVFGYEKRIAASSESWSRWIGGISRC